MLQAWKGYNNGLVGTTSKIASPLSSRAKHFSTKYSTEHLEKKAPRKIISNTQRTYHQKYPIHKPCRKQYTASHMVAQVQYPQMLQSHDLKSQDTYLLNFHKSQKGLRAHLYTKKTPDNTNHNYCTYVQRSGDGNATTAIPEQP